MTIVPIKELKDGAGISRKCHETNEPIFITRNGYDDMVIMSSECFERYNAAAQQVAEREVARQREFDATVAQVKSALDDVATDRTRDAFCVADELRAKYGL